jgi:single-stranded-DNA-specific exonuclease
MSVEYETFYTKIRGVTQTNLNGIKRQKLIKNLKVGQPVFCLREFNNPYDKNAIAVYDTEKNQLGYLSADLADSFARDMDKGLKLTVTISSLTGGFLRKRGVNLHVIVIPAPKPIKKTKPKSPQPRSLTSHLKP